MRKIHATVRLALAAAAVLFLTAPAHAQMAGALGRPLPDAQLPTGTATVKIVNGALSEPLTGIDVQLVPAEGKARTARTDPAGRATFPDLKPGTKYVARVEIDKDKKAESIAFSVPAKGGVRLMLSPVPWKQQASGAAGAKGGRPPPAQMSGRSRAESAQPRGTLSVRVLRGAWDDSVAGTTVNLVGYGADGSVTHASKKTDAGGRASFEGLDRRGRVAYYAMGVLSRAAKHDRMASFPIMMPGPSGAVVALVGKTRDATDEVDDLNNYQDQPGKVAAGTVLVEVQTALPELGTVQLLRLGQPKPVATAKPLPKPPSARSVRVVIGKPVDEPAVPAGSLILSIAHSSKKPTPLAGVRVSLALVGGDGSAVAEQTSSGAGTVRFDGLAVGSEYKATITIHGKVTESKATKISDKNGIRLPVTAAWRVENVKLARFSDVAADPDAVYLAQISVQGKLYRSPPFQLTPTLGAAVAILVVPRIMFRFHLGGGIDDKFMTFQGLFGLSNISYAPYDTGDGGVSIPLPSAYVGAQVFEKYQENVKVVRGKGFRYLGTVPPGGFQFQAGFTIKIKDGAFAFDMPLPYGVFNSSMSFGQTPGMKVNAPAGGSGHVKRGENGKLFYVMNGITILPKQRMVFSVSGLPRAADWKAKAALAAGVLVLLLLGWALVVIMRRQPEQGVGDEERRELMRQRETLLDELVDLETRRRAKEITGSKYNKAKASVTHRLERIYVQLSSDDHSHSS